MNFFSKLQQKVSGKKVLASVLISFVSIVVISIFASPAEAQNGSVSFFGIPSVGEWIATLAAYVANMVLMLAAWWIAFTGMLLNVSINITLHIKEFVNSTPAIFDVWKAIRDISGLFIIFTLLYAAIRQILGIAPPNFGDLIKNVVIAGVLINFSFFITAALIDASNVVSLAVFRSILPGQPDVGRIIDNCVNSGKNAEQCGGEAGLLGLASAGLNDGGLSALFMQSLQIQTVYDPKNMNLKESTNGLNVTFKIILISLTGAAIMIIAGLSFLAAAAAFIVRLVILVFLLAFSPILFAASVIPGIDEYAKEWKNMLKGQLIFMPAYLLFMYAALLILSKSTVFVNGATGGLWKGANMGAAGNFVPTEYMVFAINAAFVIIMLNIPLLAAVKLGGASTKFINMKKFGAQGVMGFVGAKTVGSAALRADKYLAKTRLFGGTTLGRDIAAATTGKMKKSSFGGGWRSADESKKADKESRVAKEEIKRRMQFNTAVAGVKSGRPGALPGDIKTAIKKMSDKEVVALGAKTLVQPDVIRYLKKSQFEAIKKDDGTNFTETEKAQVKEARNMALESAANNNIQDVLKDMVKEYDGKEFIGSNLLNNHYLISHLSQAQLKEIGENTDEPTQDTILDNMDLALAARLKVKAEHWLKQKTRAHEWGSNAARYP